MRAAVLVRHGEPATAFEIRELATPSPGPGQVRIAVEAFGLNYADVMARLGLYQDAPPIPSVLGYEVVGRVDAVSPGVTEFSVGQRVVALSRFGGYATHAVTDARAVVPIPDDLDPGIAVALPTQGGTAYYCAEEMVRLHPGDHVLVHAAAGGVGTLLVQLSKRRGCVVYGTAGSDAKMSFLRELGVDHPINYRTSDFVDVVRRVRGSEGLDVIFDSIGGAAVRKGIALLGSGGRIVCFGGAEHSHGSLQILRSLSFAASFGILHAVPLMMRSKGIIGVNMLRIADNRPLVLQRCLQAVVKLALDGALRPTVGGRFHAEQIADAHALLAGRASTGKIVVSWA
jgi:NADPH:quinone reductase-like Zn-dependent oxidoreductase